MADEQMDAALPVDADLDEPVILADAGTEPEQPVVAEGVAADASRRQRSPGQVFNELLAALSAAPAFANIPVGRLRQEIAAPFRHSQFRLYRRDNRLVGFASWALLSNEIERRILTGGGELAPDEWRSGDRPWMVHFAVPTDDAGSVQAELAQNVLQDRPFRLLPRTRVQRPPEGEPVVIDGVQIDHANETHEYRAVGATVWLMSQAARYRRYSVADLERLVLPPIRLRQFHLFKRTGEERPFAFACWAYLSEEAETAYVEQQRLLQPEDWRSGDRLWCIELIALNDTAWDVVRYSRASGLFPKGAARFLRRNDDGSVRRVHWN